MVIGKCLTLLAMRTTLRARLSVPLALATLGAVSFDPKELLYYDYYTALPTDAVAKVGVRRVLGLKVMVI
jgi:hypothetical protein